MCFGLVYIPIKLNSSQGTDKYPYSVTCARNGMIESFAIATLKIMMIDEEQDKKKQDDQSQKKKGTLRKRSAMILFH